MQRSGKPLRCTTHCCNDSSAVSHSNLLDNLLDAASYEIDATRQSGHVRIIHRRPTVRKTTGGTAMTILEHGTETCIGGPTLPQIRRLVTRSARPQLARLAKRRSAALPAGLTSGSSIYVAAAGGGVVVDVDGSSFIDFGSGIAVTTVGNSAPRVVERATRQLALFNTRQRGALENAVKYARAATGRPAVVVFDHAFHGRTLMTMTMTAKNQPYKATFGPFAPERIAEFCRERGILVVADEVQTGIARTGAWFASERQSRGLRGRPGEVFETIEVEGLLDRAKDIGEILTTGLSEIASDTDIIGDIRGRGAMIAIELVHDEDKAPNREAVAQIVSYAHAHGLLLLTAGTYGNVVRFLPPPSISDELLTEGPRHSSRRVLIGGAWVTGSDGTLTDTNPARPDEVVATGGRAGASGNGDRCSRRPHRRERLGPACRCPHAAHTSLAQRKSSNPTLRPGAKNSPAKKGKRWPRVVGEGVVTPFNFPIAIPAWKIAPRLGVRKHRRLETGCRVPLLAFRLAQALDRSGPTRRSPNMILADGAAGEALVDHPDLDAVTFTGSTGVGRKIAGSAAARGVPVQAEMGGKNAAVVLADADPELAVEQVMLGAFRSTGQKCTATSLTVEVKQLRVGDPLDPDVTTGPVVSAYAQQSIIEGIKRAVDGGARVVATAEAPQSGYYVQPTVLELPASTELWFEELFGPVLAVQRAATTADAFRLANEGEFGLSAALFTQDLTSALAGIDDLYVGILHVNSGIGGR
ncbi:unnamed protein product, partial [Mesorhabditis spiculigera]